MAILSWGPVTVVGPSVRRNLPPILTLRCNSASQGRRIPDLTYSGLSLGTGRLRMAHTWAEKVFESDVKCIVSQ